jgi:RNA polymerase sigma factor for flagellar operon FliA
MLDVFIYPQHTSPALERDRLIKAHLTLVDFLVDRMVAKVPAYMTRDDIRSAGMVGLLDAASRFNPGMGILFKTFAEQRIRGAIVDEARRMGWFSRTMREKQAGIAETFAQLEQRLGRVPEEAEVAAELDLDLEQYRRLLVEVGHLGLVSLQESLDPSGDGPCLLDTLEDASLPNPEQALAKKEQARELAALLATLSEKEQQVISLLYYEELTQKEIAEVLGLTEGRISQLHSQALIKLKGKLDRQRRPLGRVQGGRQ